MSRFDWTNVAARASTWLALLSAAATAALGAYALMPERAQQAFPEWVLVTLGAMAVSAAFLIPVATSFKQRGLGRAPAKVDITTTTTTTVKGDVAPEEATRIAESVATTTEPPSAPPVT